MRFKHLTIEECDIEIEKREKQIMQMVGWLYPSIVRDEIAEIRQHQETLRAGANGG